jgi:hypothetical protein
VNIIRLRSARRSDEPTAAELAEIEKEWPLIEAELELLDAEIALVTSGRLANHMDHKRKRRAERRVLTVSRELAANGTGRAAGTAVAS